jgi:thiol-disulfide isomerase/thioredoxin
MNVLLRNALCVRFCWAALLLPTLLMAQTRPSSSSTLDIGDAPPDLQPMAWIKGEPIETLGPGRVRVVLFFASWCGASRQALGELSVLARTYAGEVDFIGVNVREAERGEPTVEALSRFVEARGSGLDFAVAMDDPVETPLFKRWMRAAGTYPTPTAFIIGRDGRIAYMGFPIDTDASYLFEDALRDTLADQPRLDAARALQLAIRELVKDYLESRSLMRPVDEARETGDPLAVLAAIDQLVGERPDYAERVFHARLGALLQIDEAQALTLARTAYEEVLSEGGDAEHLAARISGLGRTLAEPSGLSDAAYTQAEAYLRDALQRQGEGYGALLDWLALAELYRGQQRFGEAAAAQERAVTLARSTRELSAEALPSLERELEADRRRAAGEPAQATAKESR